MENKINYNKVLFWVTILQALFTLAFYGYAFLRMNEKPPSGVNYSIEAEKTLERVEELQNRLTQQRETYQHKVDSLQSRMFVLKILINKELAKVKDSEKRIVYITRKAHWDTLSLKSKSLTCDSLRWQTLELIHQHKVKDSIQDIRFTDLAVSLHETQIQLSLTDSVNKVLVKEVNLSAQHTQACAEVLKKQKRRNRVLKFSAGALTVLSIFLVAR